MTTQLVFRRAANPPHVLAQLAQEATPTQAEPRQPIDDFSGVAVVWTAENRDAPEPYTLALDAERRRREKGGVAAPAIEPPYDPFNPPDAYGPALEKIRRESGR